MDSAELLGIVSRGEDTRHQFKLDVTNAKSVGAELAAFANGVGGVLLIGVTDDGKVPGLVSQDVRRIGSLIANAASQNVRPPVTFSTENVLICDRVVIVVKVPSGTDKPYFDCEGVIWQRVGPDKRRVHSKEELRRIFQDSGLLQADAVPVPDVDSKSVDLRVLAKVMTQLDEPAPRSAKAAWGQLERMGLVRAGHLTFAGLLLFAKRPQHFRPQFSLKAVYFSGKDQGSTTFLDSEDYEGRLPQLFDGAFAFLRRNLRKVQAPRRSINSRGVLEIPENVFEELLCNALLHRDYLIDAPTRLLLFDDRIEIVSPGLLAGGLTVENISRGASFIRNPLLTSFAIKGLLPYRGLGTGIHRVLQQFPTVQFVNDTAALLFRAVVQRPTRLTSAHHLPRRTLNIQRGSNDERFLARMRHLQMAEFRASWARIVAARPTDFGLR
jgi:ATP-dependent DNA helicase RecG